MTSLTVALALVLKAGIWTSEQDFLGCGLPTWTTETLISFWPTNMNKLLDNPIKNYIFPAHFEPESNKINKRNPQPLLVESKKINK